MNNREIMLRFFRSIKYHNLFTNFLIKVFDYHELTDHNYIYRLQSDTDSIILDIYDNVTVHCFNRYIFSFNCLEKNFQVYENDGVFVTIINVLNSDGLSKNKLIKLAYLFSLEKSGMLNYAKTFLNEEFVEILSKIIK